MWGDICLHIFLERLCLVAQYFPPTPKSLQPTYILSATYFSIACISELSTSSKFGWATVGRLGPCAGVVDVCVCVCVCGLLLYCAYFYLCIMIIAIGV